MGNTQQTSQDSGYTCIDLFCGCGGFSLGAQRAGLKVLAGIDLDPHAMEVYRKNLPAVPHALEENLRKSAPEALAALIGTDRVDVIIGGPPCQGYSTVRQADGSNSGPRMVNDSRRHLYKEFLRYVKYFRPSIFVMENVTGIRSAEDGKYFAKAQLDARRLGYRVHSQVERSSDLGVPQKRVRQLIIGTRADCPAFFRGTLMPAPRAVSNPTLGEAICDLPPLAAGQGKEESDYDKELRKSHIEKYGEKYLYETLEVKNAGRLTSHRARPHSARDLGDFAKLREGEHCAEAAKRGVKFDFPYSRKTFKDRYTRQHRNELCSTIVAHLSKDGLMFIHPTQDRSLTPREAARVQSFPDWFEFPLPRTSQFRLIGNAVPPLVGEAVGLAARAYLDSIRHAPGKATSPFVPGSCEEARTWLRKLVNGGGNGHLRKMPDEDIVRGWNAIAFLDPTVHPESALEPGQKKTRKLGEPPWLDGRDRRLFSQRYRLSGWPVKLVPAAREVWRRCKKGRLRRDDVYCSESLRAGLAWRETRPHGQGQEEQTHHGNG